MRIILLIAILISITGYSCKGVSSRKDVSDKSSSIADTIPTDFDESIVGSFSTQIKKKFDTQWVDSFLLKYPAFDKYKSEIEDFYNGRNYAYAWFDKEGMTESAFHLFNRVMHLDKTVSGDSVIYQQEFSELMDETPTEEDAPMLDIMLTGQYFAYSHRAYKGISQNRIRNLNWNIPRKRINPVVLLDSFLKNKNGVFENEPVYSKYRLLRHALQKFREKGLDTLTTKIEPSQRSYRLGDSSNNILLLRQRLFLLGDIPSSNGSAKFDKELDDGIKSFQSRHGIKADGVSGPAFFRELNVSGKDRLKQILLNMERLRWIPVKMDGEHLMVNIPEYKLYAYNGDSLLWDMNVVVGTEANKSVIFNDEISYMAFSPFWNVPPGILRRSVLPAMRRNSNYLRNNNMEIVGYNGNTPRIRQRPGGSNPMGKVKFMFPNRYNIYLHDSPVRELFDQTNRARSAGCIRVSDAEFLANFLLKDQPEWTPERIKNEMNSSRERNVNLKYKMPVLLGYFTAWADKSGKIHFGQDIYNRDKKLENILFN